MVDNLLSVAESAAIANTTEATIRVWIHKGWVTAVRVGPRKLGINRTDLESFLRQPVGAADKAVAS